MIFTKDSGVVKVWVTLILSNTYKLEDVPELYNLRQVVSDVLNGLV